MPRLKDRLKALEKRISNSLKVVPDTPSNRRKAKLFVTFMDHEMLRHTWTNEDEIAPGVWRSNHPTPRRLKRIRDRGIKTVINLRGGRGHVNYKFEEEICARLGLHFDSVSLSASQAPKAANVLKLIDLFRTVDRPFLMHCKSGADRAGLASAIYMMVIEGEPVEKARRMLSLRYLHVRRFRTGVLDLILDRYAERNARAPIGFEDWISTEYDREALQADFDAQRR